MTIRKTEECLLSRSALGTARKRGFKCGARCTNTAAHVSTLPCGPSAHVSRPLFFAEKQQECRHGQKAIAHVARPAFLTSVFIFSPRTTFENAISVLHTVFVRPFSITTAILRRRPLTPARRVYSPHSPTDGLL